MTLKHTMQKAIQTFPATSIYLSLFLFCAQWADAAFDPTIGAGTLRNPLKFNTITELFTAILQIITVFAVPVIVFFIIFAGFKYVTAGGNAEKVTSATHALTWALVGGVIVLGAQVLLAVIQSTVAALQP